MNTNKAIHGKNYGSIMHLHGSKLGQGDREVNEGMNAICTVAPRSKDDRIIVQFKYDGSNVGVVKINGKLVPITRKGYTCVSSPHYQHHVFARWVDKNKSLFDALLNEGDRICGEWLYQPHSIVYDFDKSVKAPFVAFDIFRGGNRLTYGEFSSEVEKVYDFQFETPFLLKIGNAAYNPTELIAQDYPFNFNIEPRGGKHEGLIYRVESVKKGKVLFLAKWVRPDFEPGKMLFSGENGQSCFYPQFAHI